MESKIDKMKGEINQNDKKYEGDIENEKYQRKIGMEDRIQEDSDKLVKDGSLLFKLKENTENNTNLIGRLFDMQDIAKKDSEAQYQRQLLQRKREHKEELNNLKEQYAFLIKEKDEKLQAFVEDFKELKHEAQ